MGLVFSWPHDRLWKPMSGRMRLRPLSQMSASPYTGSVKAAGLGLLWVADFTFNNHDLAQGHAMQGFIDGLEGAVNPVRLFDWWRQVPALLSSAQSGFSDDSLFTDGTGFTDGYAPRVVTAAERGARFVHMTGLPAAAACFSRGDLFGLGGFLYEVRSESVSANAAGEALVPVLPGLRASIAADDPVTLWRPTVTMRMLPGDEGVMRSFNASEGFTLSFVEDVP